MTNREVIEIMKPLWSGHSASKLAKICSERLGRIVTRNAILGVAHRNRDLFPVKSPERVRQNKVHSNRRAAIKRRKRRKTLAAVKPPYLPQEPFNTPERALMPLIMTKPRHCRWPFTKDGTHYSCGHVAVKGHAYCAAHKFIATKQT